MNFIQAWIYYSDLFRTSHKPDLDCTDFYQSAKANLREGDKTWCQLDDQTIWFDSVDVDVYLVFEENRVFEQIVFFDKGRRVFEIETEYKNCLINFDYAIYNSEDIPAFFNERPHLRPFIAKYDLKKVFYSQGS